MPNVYMYSSHRDRAKKPAWKDLNTGRFISCKTLMKRTGLTLQHIKGYENGADGRGYRMPREEREAVEKELNVCLCH